MNVILGRKLGMTQVFTDDGSVVPVTVVSAGPCTVVQKRTDERDGYHAVQLGYEEVGEKRLSGAEVGHCKAAGVAAVRVLQEVRLDGPSDLEVGAQVTVSLFSSGDKVKVTGRAKGRGFQGVIKRHNFSGGPKTHGSHFHRAPGSIGASAWPAHVQKGQKLPGQMGNHKVTTSNLEIVEVDAEENLLLIKGTVPGGRNGLVRITRA